ncbi:hypothetical protein [Rhizobacter fulvus]
MGDLHPEVIISHRMPLTDAARGYEMFNEKQEDCRKVVLTPGRSGSRSEVPSNAAR